MLKHASPLRFPSTRSSSTRSSHASSPRFGCFNSQVDLSCCSIDGLSPGAEKLTILEDKLRLQSRISKISDTHLKIWNHSVTDLTSLSIASDTDTNPSGASKNRISVSKISVDSVLNRKNSDNNNQREEQLGTVSMSPQSTQVSTSDKFNERGVDCEGLTPSPKRALLGQSMEAPPTCTGWGIGPVITHGRAIVRRGLSFTLRREPDVNSIRSVKSEGQVPSSSKNMITEPILPSELKKANPKELKPFTQLLSSKEKKEIPAKHSYPSETNLNMAPKLASETSVLPNHADSQYGFHELRRTMDSSDPLRSLLQLPGIHAEVRLPDTAVTSSPTILNPDTMSLTSADSLATSSSGRTSSRSWGSSAAASTSSNSSSNSGSEITSTTIRVFAKCLRSDIEYKTVSVGPRTTCGELVASLLSKYRMKHRDPNLFYLTMEVTVKRLQSQYKSLLVSYRTRAEEVVQLMLNCCGRSDARCFYALHQVCRSPSYSDVRLSPDERPLEVKATWPLDRRDDYVFVLRRNMSDVLSLRKLSDITSAPVEPLHASHQGASAPKPDAPRRSQSLGRQRPRLQSVPIPPPRSRKNISHFQQSLLDSSLLDGAPGEYSALHQETVGLSTAQVVTNDALMRSTSHYYNSQRNAVGESSTQFHRSIMTRNTINYNVHDVHFGRPPDAVNLPNNDATVIDCTFATPVMKQIGSAASRPRRSLSASRLPLDPRLTVAPSIDLYDLPSSQSERQSRSPKTITWIEKTWTTTGCQTILSCTSKPIEREDIYSKSIRDLTPPRERPSRRKHVNFADELQYEVPSPTTEGEKNLSKICPPAIPPPPESDISSESSSPPPPPSVPPPPLTPPMRSHKRVTLNDEVCVDPPPTPGTSPSPSTPEQVRVIKPCIKYPKTQQRSSSAPSSPSLRKVTLSTPLIPNNTEHSKMYATQKLVRENLTEKILAKRNLQRRISPSPSSVISTPDAQVNPEQNLARKSSNEQNKEDELSGAPPPVPPPPAPNNQRPPDEQEGNSEDSAEQERRLRHSSGTCERNCKDCFYI
ncbi:uncharacterized protein LOC108673746 [Hyalella azteca]|uniref:Uncharacterized protein LOC108673746 n=1 Tax=Hyalella azteca TaxID=294128 RepID=A0A8B7NTQ8_HYAAZ|nr:uncharacterized protein LOC108673746 [Hyalella azteca]